jgi:RNA polymerase sigma-70 factor (ECF subfamily)
MMAAREPRNRDDSLVSRAREGDRGAFDELFGVHRDRLEAYVRLRIGAHLRARVEVDDVVQETSARALQSIERFHAQDEGSFLRWLKGIAEHVILQLAERRERDQVLYVEAEALAADASPSQTLRRGERFDRLQAALDSLPPDYREVIVLSRLRGLRLKEIAVRMQRSPNAVAHLLSRALGELKAAFGDTESLGLPSRPLDGGGPRRDER